MNDVQTVSFFSPVHNCTSTSLQEVQKTLSKRPHNVSEHF